MLLHRLYNGGDLSKQVSYEEIAWLVHKFEMDKPAPVKLTEERLKRLPTSPQRPTPLRLRGGAHKRSLTPSDQDEHRPSPPPPFPPPASPPPSPSPPSPCDREQERDDDVVSGMRPQRLRGGSSSNPSSPYGEVVPTDEEESEEDGGEEWSGSKSSASAQPVTKQEAKKRANPARGTAHDSTRDADAASSSSTQPVKKQKANKRAAAPSCGEDDITDEEEEFEKLKKENPTRNCKEFQKKKEVKKRTAAPRGTAHESAGEKQVGRGPANSAGASSSSAPKIGKKKKEKKNFEGYAYPSAAAASSLVAAQDEADVPAEESDCSIRLKELGEDPVEVEQSTATEVSSPLRRQCLRPRFLNLDPY